MEQFRQIGEVIGSMNAIMVFKEDITINQRQCCLLQDMFTSAYTTIAQEMKKSLKFEEKNSKWKVLESPLKEILRVFKEGETYIKQCIEVKDWDPNIFQWKFGDQYIITKELCNRTDSAYDEDRWLLLKKLQERKILPSSRKKDHKLVDALLRSLNACDKINDKLLPNAILVSSKDYQVRRRLGGGSQYKEIHWLGESFALRHILGELEVIVPNPTRYFDLSHPNILNILCGFQDEERKECLVVMELMSRDLSTYIKEICGTKLIAILSSLRTDGYAGKSFRVWIIVLYQLYTKILAKENVQPSFIWYAPGFWLSKKNSGIRLYHPREKADVYNFWNDCNQLRHPIPQTDYNDIETGFLRCFPSFNNSEILQPVTQIPFHMFAYKVGEKDKEKSHHISEKTRILRVMELQCVEKDNVINVGDPLPHQYQYQGSL
ncbi:hypothetical protein Leryth_013168 [Lithospermum erythrorhizon]|nr:hypothetical protein Leryth_013168 [Lithospermum erythrorhizon]